MQKILIIQEINEAEIKIKWIRKYNCLKLNNSLKIKTISFNLNLPSIIKDSQNYLPKNSNSNIILDYIRHPDLSQDLSRMHSNKNVVIIASGKKNIENTKYVCPPICCALHNDNRLKQYGKHFGKPILEVKTKNDVLSSIKIIRGAPCGSTWEASKKMRGHKIKNSPKIFGLNIQYLCKAKHISPDKTKYENPIHLSANIHKASLKSAINKEIDVKSKIR